MISQLIQFVASSVALAEMSGLLECGERSPNLDTAKAIAGALGIPLGNLIAEAERIQNRRQ